MTNEQTIDGIMNAVFVSQEKTAAYDKSYGPGTEKLEREMFAADNEVRNLITAALAAKDAELKQRLTDSGRDLQAIKADPALGEWVEWKGGECPLPGDVRVRVKFKDGIEGDDYPAGGWVWEHILGPDNIVAYRVLP